MSVFVTMISVIRVIPPKVVVLLVAHVFPLFPFWMFPEVDPQPYPGVGRRRRGSQFGGSDCKVRGVVPGGGRPARPEGLRNAYPGQR